jgi:membrane carboxypeptidase/penicillin-binding protein
MVLAAATLGIPAGFLLAHTIRAPRVKTLADYQPAIITRIYDRTGIPFAEYSIQKRIVIPKKDMAPVFVQAVIATEDSEFYRHGGVDPKAIARAVVKDVIERRRAQGASTLTQQLAKQVFLTPEKSFRRKINEVFLAVQIEKEGLSGAWRIRGRSGIATLLRETRQGADSARGGSVGRADPVADVLQPHHSRRSCENAP